MLKDSFHSLIDSFVQVFPVAKHKNTWSRDRESRRCSRFAVRSVSWNFVYTHGLRLAHRGGYRRSLALVGGGLPCEQTNLQGAHKPPAIVHVDLSCRFWIEFGQLRAQIIQTHRVQ